ncbi:MAG: DUF4214 domain-containing protein [Clostridiales bacterium]|nr:DUF4214 domain-containing protein [Candidatus Apopatocola equi]
MNAMTRRRFLSILLCCVLLLGVFPIAAFAQDAEEAETALEEEALPAEKLLAEEEAVIEAEAEGVEEPVELFDEGFEQDGEEPLEINVIGADLTGFQLPMYDMTIGRSPKPLVPANAPYKIDSFQWFISGDPDDPLDGDDEFLPGQNYFAKITLAITEAGYEFAGNGIGRFSINGGLVGIQRFSFTEEKLVLWTVNLSPNRGYEVFCYDENVTLNGSSNIAMVGFDYSCTLTPDYGYELSKSDIRLFIGTEEVTQTMADYWDFNEATQELTVNHVIIEDSIIIYPFVHSKTYTVNFVNKGHSTIIGETTATHGAAYAFTVNTDPGYDFSSDCIEVYRDGQRIFDYSVNDHTVTIDAEAINADLTIYVEALPDYDASGMEGFVSRMYWNLLGRAPSEQDIADGVWQLSNGTSGIQYAYQFAFSNEFCAKNLCDIHFSDALFEAFIGRAPSESELNYRAYQLQQGQSREQVFNDLVTSEEFRNICTEAGISLGSPVEASGKGTKPGGRCTVSDCHSADKIDAFSERLYTEALKRTPAPDEVDAWTFYLIHGEHTAKSAAKFFFFSEELVGMNLSNADFMQRLYRCMMNREASAAEIDYWVWCLTTDNSEYRTTREGAFNQFVDSDEFRVLCQDYGMICE